MKRNGYLEPNTESVLLARVRAFNRECSQVRMVDTISQPGCAECGAGGLVLTDYRPYAFLRALFG